MGSKDSWWTIPVASLLTVVSDVLVLLPSMYFELFDLWPWPLTFFNPKSIKSISYPKVIPCTKFKGLGVIRFWVIMRTSKQTNKQTESQTDADNCLTHATTVCVGNDWYCRKPHRPQRNWSSRLVTTREVEISWDDMSATAEDGRIM